MFHNMINFMGWINVEAMDRNEIEKMKGNYRREPISPCVLLLSLLLACITIVI